MRHFARMAPMQSSPSISHFMRGVAQRAAVGVRALCLLVAVVGAVGCKSDSRLAPAAHSEPELRSSLKETGPCEEGAVRACSRVLEATADLVHCLKSEQTCEDGAWTPCGEQGAALIVQKRGAPAEEGPSRGTLSLSMPSNNVGNCNADPCSVGCMGFDEQPPSPLQTPGFVASYVNGNPWGNAPAGFIGKQDCSGSCATGYPKNCNGTPQHNNKFDGCLADHHCEASSGNCVRNGAGWTWPASTCAGVDLTVGPWCTRYDGVTVIDGGFPICNRGNTALAAGSVVKVAIKNGDWLNLVPSSVSVTGAQLCNLTLTQALEPGTCTRMTETTCNPGNGNAVAFINYDGSIAECGYPETTPLTMATAPGRSNNWSDIKKGANSCVELTAADTLVHVEDYTAVCGYNETPTWDLLTFTSTIGCSPATCDGTNGGSVTFEAQTALSSSPTTFSSKVTVASAPSVQAANCTLSGPTPDCPASLGNALGKVDREKSVLRLTITLEPSPDKQVASSLSDWQVTYRCIPSD